MSHMLLGIRVQKTTGTGGMPKRKVLYSCGFALHGYPQLVLVDEEPEDQVVHTLRLGKTTFHPIEW